MEEMEMREIIAFNFRRLLAIKGWTEREATEKGNALIK